MAHRSLPPRLSLETLEDRCVPAGSVAITDAFLRDGNGDRQAAPYVGQQIQAEVDWTTSGLDDGTDYTVQFTLDGVTLSSSTLTTQSGDGLTFNWDLGGWYASPGDHTLDITVDPDHNIDADESAASTELTFTSAEPTTLPQLLGQPIAGTQGVDWAITNYLDVDPTGGKADYNGGPFTYDGHTGYDISIANFARMDQGVPVYAAADGTVSAVADGNFDRQTDGNPDNPPNYVIIDHGNGWSTVYFHLRRDSITVQPGDTVTAGEQIGLVGSAGVSTGPHLHFEINYTGLPVEAGYDPSAYFINPIPYQGDQSLTVLDSGITNSDPGPDIAERPVTVSTFPTSASDDVWLWYDYSDFAAGDQLEVDWIQPDGTVAATYNDSADTASQGGFQDWTLGPDVWSQQTGTWTVTVSVNGNQVLSQNFDVTDGAGDAVARLSQNGTYILPTRTTPIDFGNANVGDTPPTLDFTVQNVGYDTLNLDNLQLPAGVSLVSDFPTSIDPGSSADFTLQMNTDSPLSLDDVVQFTTNDPNQPQYAFHVGGSVSGEGIDENGVDNGTVNAATPMGVCNFDPTSGTWYQRNSDSSGFPTTPVFAYGLPGWKPVTGDWNGDGTTSVGVVDPTTMTWYLRNSNSAGAPDITPFQFGAPGWIPVTGDWTGSGHTGIGVYDPSTATWYLENDPGSGKLDFTFQYGFPGWTPVTGDWDGNGTTTIGVVDPNSTMWYLRNDNSAGAPDITPFPYGLPGWKPVTGDWNGTGHDGIGVVYPVTSTWYLRNDPSAGFPDVTPFAYGYGGWAPLSGDWQFQGHPLNNIPSSVEVSAAGAVPDLQASSASPAPSFAPLTQDQLLSARDTALTQLSAQGVSPSVIDRLQQVDFQVGSLPGTLLGEVDHTTNTVLIDSDGAGYGWNVSGSGGGQQMDLLTAVLHEMGTMSGRPEDAAKGLMNPVLRPGEQLTDPSDVARVFGGA